MKKNVFKTPSKLIKKFHFFGQTAKMRKIISLMIVGGILSGAVYLCRYIYIASASSKAFIVLSYPEIAKSQYPDGSRFTFYDFINDDRLSEAIDIMRKKGKYEYISVDDLRDSFYLYGYLESSASSDVLSERSAGNDFSYVANEYKLTFIQPHDYHNPVLLNKFLSKDDSKEFLEALVESNQKYISETKGGIGAFKAMTALDDWSNYDYDEKIEMYKAKKKAIIEYLRNLDSVSPKFRSKEDGISIKDLQSECDLIITNKINNISSYIDSTGASKQPEVTSNKIKINIENYRLKLAKATDQATITRYAMNNYDHTFTENLINVVRDESQGLYQARPKTSFDSIVVRMNNAIEDVSDYNEELYELSDDLNRVNASMGNEFLGESNKRCEELFAELDSEYKAFSEKAVTIVSECLNETNSDFLTADISRKQLISTKLLIKTGIMFAMGALVVFVLCVMLSMYKDAINVRRRKKLLAEIRNTKKEDK